LGTKHVRRDQGRERREQRQESHAATVLAFASAAHDKVMSGARTARAASATGRGDSPPWPNDSHPKGSNGARGVQNEDIMLRLWKVSYTRPTPLRGAALSSVATHLLLIGAWVAGTQPLATMSRDSLANRVYYIPPVDKPQVAFGTREVVHYITLAAGAGIGPGPTAIDERRPAVLAEHSRDLGARAVDSTVQTPEKPGDPRGDSIFTEIDVDTAVVRSQSSAAPAYPLELLNKHVEGTVLARYIVDTTGFADTTSLEVLDATHQGFVSAVREALPYMRFSPAKIGSHKVRQLVQQSFTFRISPAVAEPAKPTVAKPEKGKP
jgi:hypothetical protein